MKLVTVMKELNAQSFFYYLYFIFILFIYFHRPWLSQEIVVEVARKERVIARTHLEHDIHWNLLHSRSIVLPLSKHLTPGVLRVTVLVDEIPLAERLVFLKPRDRVKFFVMYPG